MNDLERNTNHIEPNSSKRIRKKSVQQKILFCLGFVCIVLLLFAPQIASFTFVPGLLRSAIDRVVTGEVQISGVRLSWLGSQRIDAIRIPRISRGILPYST